MTAMSAQPRPRYDAFISYSHASDESLAPALRSGLERLGRRWTQRRALRVFQDASGLAATPQLWSTIAAALDESRFLVLLASPASAASEWVQQELARFIARHGADDVLIVLTDGLCAWSEDAGDFDWAATTALSPHLRGVFAQEPLWLDLRWASGVAGLDLAHPRFRQDLTRLGAAIHGTTPDELDAVDLRVYRRGRALRRAATVAIAALAVISTVAGVLALANAGRADERARAAVAAATEAEARRLAATSLGVVVDQTDLAVLLARASLNTSPTAEGRAALAAAMTRPAAALGWIRGENRPGWSAALSPDGSLLAAADSTGAVNVYRMDDRSLVIHLTSPYPPLIIDKPATTPSERALLVDSLSFDRTGRHLAAGLFSGRALVWEVSTGRSVFTVDGAYGAVFDPDSDDLLAVSEHRVARYAGNTWRRLWTHQLDAPSGFPIDATHRDPSLRGRISVSAGYLAVATFQGAELLRLKDGSRHSLLTGLAGAVGCRVAVRQDLGRRHRPRRTALDRHRATTNRHAPVRPPGWRDRPRLHG